MGAIEFEGWDVEVDDIEALNMSQEVSRLGLVFEQYPGVISASAKGNVSVYYNILVEVRRRMVSGGFNVTVELSTGEKRKVLLTPSFVTEDGKDISSLLR